MLERVETATGAVVYVSPLLRRLGVPHAFTTRLGGVSGGPFTSLNLGNPNGCALQDDVANIAENYRRVLAGMGCAGRERLHVHQVHSSGIAVAGVGEAFDIHQQADALVTADAVRVLSVRVADCVPVLVSDPGGRVVAAVHAGWRGVIAGIVPLALAAVCETSVCERSRALANDAARPTDGLIDRAADESVDASADRLVDARAGKLADWAADGAVDAAAHAPADGPAGELADRPAADARAADARAADARAADARAADIVGGMVVAIGPSIGVGAFEVGPEVLAEFERVFGPAAPLSRRPDGKGHVDLRAAIRLQLLAAGVADDHIDTTDRCTARDAHEFFSHRRDNATTGRMSALIGCASPAQPSPRSIAPAQR